MLVGSGSGSEEPRARGRLSAYDLRTGRLRWSTATVPEGANGGGVICSPTVDLRRGRVYVTTGAPYAAVDGPNPGTCSLLELRLADGAVTWADQVHVHDTRGLDLNGAAVLLGDRAFATAKDGVHGWDRALRRRVWHTQLTPESQTPGGPSGPTDGPELGPLATDGRRLYALSNDGARGVAVAAALDPRDGRVLWRAELPGLVFAAPALAGNALWTATASGSLHALRTVDGAPLAAVDLGEPSAGAVSAAAGVVLAGTGAAPDLPGESLVCVGAKVSNPAPLVFAVVER
ncbi:MAG TPA: PQQ-binding-like beta-propeller repeat protein [Baekduia sp.]|nr:PQQ-binding-like beta-propeller repeat protein [Baekduia sp.]